jgi:hypothetical protein
MEAKQIKIKINAIKKAGVKFQDNVQTVAEVCCNHAIECGDWTLFNNLVLAIPTGARQASLIRYIMAYTPLNSFNYEKQSFTKPRKNKETGEYQRPFDVAGMQSVKWFEFEVEPKVKTVDYDTMADTINKAVASIVARFDKADIKKGDQEQGEKLAELVQNYVVENA